MEVLNNTSEEIVPKGMLRMYPALWVSDDIKSIIFYADAVTMFKMKSGKYVHFINDEDEWFFYFNNDKDGFLLSPKKFSTDLCILNSSLAKLFMSRTGTSEGTIFDVLETKIEMKGLPVYKIEKRRIQWNFQKQY